MKHMSLKDKNMSFKDSNNKAASHFDVKSVTRYFEKSQRVKWTIETVSKLPGFVEIEGPYTSLNNLSMVLLLRKNQNELSIYLRNTSKQSFSLDINFTLLDYNGTKLHEGTKQDFFLQEGGSVCTIWKMNSLKNDQLIINCFLKMVEYVTKSDLQLKSPEEYQKKLLDDLKLIYNNPNGSDIKLHVGDGLIHAHKIILGLRSTYFKTMFKTNQNSVLITDVSYCTMKILVEFLYTGTFNIANEENFVQETRNLYIAADKYQLIDLKSLCVDKLLSYAEAENILEILQLAVNYNDERLKTEAMKLVPFHFDRILKSDAWKTFYLSDGDLASEITMFCFKKT